MRLNEVETSIPLEEYAKKSLIELNYRFFMAEIEFDDSEFRRIDKVEMLEDTTKKNILDSIVGVYCSSFLESHVSSILKEFNINVDLVSV